MLVRDVALDLALVDEVGEDALADVAVHVLLAEEAEDVDVGVDGDLGGVEEAGELLEQVAVRRRLQLLQEQVHPALDEEVLELEHVRVELEHVALLHRAHDRFERLQLVLGQQALVGHVAY